MEVQKWGQCDKRKHNWEECQRRVITSSSGTYELRDEGHYRVIYKVINDCD